MGFRVCVVLLLCRLTDFGCFITSAIKQFDYQEKNKAAAKTAAKQILSKSADLVEVHMSAENIERTANSKINFALAQTFERFEIVK